MFEAGKTYSFKLFRSDGEESFVAQVVDVNGYLIKLEHGEILNTISSAFVSAEPYPKVAGENTYARFGFPEP